MSWCTIESDPGVFTELVQALGVRGVQVEELYSLDDLPSLPRVYGLIFLFRWRPGEQEDRTPLLPEDVPDVFFANQVITNACATQAILSVLLNLPEHTTLSQQGGDPVLDIGPHLRQLKEFTFGLPPDMKGLAINNSDVIRTVHNTFAPQHVFDLENVQKDDKDEDVFHFIAYVPVDGQVFELDGLKPGPFLLGIGASQQEWIEVARTSLQERIERFSEQEIHFSLLAIVPDRLDQLQLQLSQSTSEWETAHVKEEISREQQKRAQWSQENRRRRWNYVPFLMNFLRVLAERNELVPLMEQAMRAGNPSSVPPTSGSQSSQQNSTTSGRPAGQQ